MNDEDQLRAEFLASIVIPGNPALTSCRIYMAIVELYDLAVRQEQEITRLRSLGPDPRS